MKYKYDINICFRIMKLNVCTPVYMYTYIIFHVVDFYFVFLLNNGDTKEDRFLKNLSMVTNYLSYIGEEKKRASDCLAP